MRTGLITFLLLSCSTLTVQAEPLFKNIGISTEVDSGYLLQEPNYLVTNHPVAQTNVFIPVIGGFYVDEWDSHQLYEPFELFGHRGDEWDSTLGWNGSAGDYELNGALAYWAIAGSENDIGSARFTVRRAFGSWKPFLAVEDQLSMPTGGHTGFVHAGTDVSFELSGIKFQNNVDISWLTGGKMTFADTLSTKVTINDVALKPIVRMSTDDRAGGVQATFGVGFDLN